MKATTRSVKQWKYVNPAQAYLNNLSTSLMFIQDYDLYDEVDENRTLDVFQ